MKRTVLVIPEPFDPLLQSLYDDSLVTIANQSDTIANQQSDITALTLANSNLLSANSGLLLDNSNLQLSNSSLSDSNSSLTNQLTTANSDVASLTTQLTTANGTINNQSNTIANLTNNNNSLTTQLTNANNAINSLTTQLTNSSNIINSLNNPFTGHWWNGVTGNNEKHLYLTQNGSAVTGYQTSLNLFLALYRYDIVSVTVTPVGGTYASGTMKLTVNGNTPVTNGVISGVSYSMNTTRNSISSNSINYTKQ